MLSMWLMLIVVVLIAFSSRYLTVDLRGGSMNADRRTHRPRGR